MITFSDGTEMYKCDDAHEESDSLFRLYAVAYLFTSMDTVSTYSVQPTWFDYGAKLWWNTIICEKKTNGDSYQMLSPLEYKQIIFASGEELLDVAKQIYEKRLWK